LRRSCGGSLDGNGRNETIAATGECLYKTGIICVVAQGVTQLLDRNVKASVELDESILRPELIPQFLAGHDLARPLQQQNQHAEGLILQGHVLTLSNELSRIWISLKQAETKHVSLPGRTGHAFPPLNLLLAQKSTTGIAS